MPIPDTRTNTQSNIQAAVLSYLNALHTIHNSGRATEERTYYPPLAALFNAIGSQMSPRLVALHDVADRGGIGHPDFLLQVESTNDTRAAVEVKGTAPDLDAIIRSEQVRRYLAQHDPTLVTNLRDFALLRRDRNGNPVLIMRYDLATSEAAFWSASPLTVARQHAEQFGDFLVTVMQWDAVIRRPVDLAEALARYAREALRRLESQPVAALAGLRKAMAAALGLEFTDMEGEHFFRSSLVQTLFYGLFSAWVACHRRGDCTDFRWREAGDYLGLPLVRELFENIARPGQLETFDIRKPIEWAEATLNRTDWSEFSRTFDEQDAVNYFYEPFLQAFDPRLREELGVWYTPREIVRYMVARVDTVLREEMGIADGLADPNVYVLDPCCGTGAYLLETLRFIGERLKERGESNLMGAELLGAAQKRIFGFEILPAPFVVAHLQVGSLLSAFGQTPDREYRAGIYLTNALTGWENRENPNQPLTNFPDFPQLQKEADAATNVKREQPILVILGNPPYSGFAGTGMKEEQALTRAYRDVVRAPAPQGQGLNDLYVRFFRMAERRIAEKTGKGIVCFISNYSWLDGLSHTGMRERYLTAFDKIWIDNLHGNRIISEYAPDGRTSETVFAIRGSSPGIQIGTAISTFVRTAGSAGHKEHDATIHYSDFDQARAEDRRAALLNSVNSPSYAVIKPLAEIGFPFKPSVVSPQYLTWSKLPDIFPANVPGVTTGRDSALVDIDRAKLITRIEQYFDPGVSHAQMRDISPAVMQKTVRFAAESVRDTLQTRGMLRENVVRYTYRPFDTRWLYYEPTTNLLDRNRADFFPRVFEGNKWLFTTGRTRKATIEPAYSTGNLADYNVMDSGMRAFPLYLRHVSAEQANVMVTEPNLSNKAIAYLDRIGSPAPESLFYHAIAVMHSTAYRTGNAGALRQDWPRIPLPSGRDVLEQSAALGKQIAALLDSETPVPGVNIGSIREDLRSIAVLQRTDGGQVNPDTDFRVQARWGYSGRGGITMPGTGRAIERVTDRGVVIDVYLNDTTYWANIPAAVWEYTMGGYQVIKKWLSYREFALLGRSLTLDEVREVTAIARRIAAILMLDGALDENYGAVIAHTVGL